MRLGAAHGEDTSVMIWLSSRAAYEWKDLVTVVEVVVSARLRRRWRDMIYKGPACGIRGSRWA